MDQLWRNIIAAMGAVVAMVIAAEDVHSYTAASYINEASSHNHHYKPDMGI